jgi:hypothetical protein
MSHIACSPDPVAVLLYPRTAAASLQASRDEAVVVDDEQMERYRALDGGLTWNG